MNDNLVSIIYIVGAVQGGLIAILLLLRRPSFLFIQLMASFLLVLAVDCFSVNRLWLSEDPIFWHFNMGNIFLFGPLLFLFVKYAINRQNQINFFDFIHFLPFLVTKFLVVIYPEYYTGEKNVPFWLATLTNQFLTFQGIIYTFFALLSARKAFSENRKNLFLKWIYSLTILSLFGWSISFFGRQFDQFGIIWGPLMWKLVYIFVVFLIYYISFRLFQTPSLFEETRPDELRKQPEREKYRNSSLTSFEAQQKIALLKGIMEQEKPFLDTTLTLDLLALKMNVARHHLSQLLNEHLQTNFFEFVNAYRLEAVKERLTNPSYAHYNILALAYECGFNSKSTFNKYFKDKVGLTPSEYRRKIH